MSLGPLMVDIEGIELSAEEREVLRHPLVGGVILFTRNFESVEQVRKLVDDIHALREPRLLVAVDQEGGRVQRFRSGFTRLPAVRGLGRLYDRDQKQALLCAEASGWLMASELRAVDVDISFAPILDLDVGVSGVIGDRAFHEQPHVVAELAHAYIIGMRNAGMASTGKHFPGHGSVEADSHFAVPVDHRSYQDIASHDMFSFERMIRYGLAAVMMAHVIYTQADSRVAGYSPYWIEQVLRQTLDFQGAVFSDDLSMAGADTGGEFGERARTALLAGCDMVLVCNNPAGRDSTLAHIGDLDNPISHLRLARMHGKHGRTMAQLHADPRWQQAVRTVQSYDPEPLLDMDM